MRPSEPRMPFFMFFRPDWFPFILCAASWPLIAVLLAATAKPALQSLGNIQKSAFTLATLLLSCAWMLEAVPDHGHLAGMSYHLLAVNLTALMVGIPAALWLGVGLFLPYFLLHGGTLSVYPLNAAAVLIPALCVNFVARSIVRRLPPNLFIFIFINGFIASAASMLVTGLVLVAVLDWSHAFPSAVLWSSAFPVFFLLSWAEGFLSGIASAVFIALKPHWITSFDDSIYLKKNNKIW